MINKNNKSGNNLGKHAKVPNNKKKDTKMNPKIKQGESEKDIKQHIDADIGKAFENDKKTKKSHKALKIVLSIIIIIIVLIGSVFGYYVYKSDGSVSGAIMNIVKDTIGEKEPVFVLVMGVSEDISAQLTDTIMLVRF